MRKLMLISAMVLLATAAFGQVTVLSGYATNQGWGGYYSAPPFVPLVTTPIVTLNTVSPSAAGASNATTGLVAGATNSTLSMLQPSPTSVYTVPTWSGYEVVAPTVAPSVPPTTEAAPQPTARAAAPRRLEVGIASSEIELAPMAKNPRQHEHATRVYTNADIDRINQQNGTVKYDGKTLHIG